MKNVNQNSSAMKRLFCFSLVLKFFRLLVKAEVNERVDFLESMAAVGKRKEYQTIIMTEISQVKNLHKKTTRSIY